MPEKQVNILSPIEAEYTREEHPDPAAATMHVHNAHEILYFIGGDASYMVEGNEYRLKPGCIMLMMQGEAHRLKLRSASPYERIVINFTDDFWSIPELCGDFLAPLRSKPIGTGNYFDPDPDFKVYLSACVQNDELKTRVNLMALLIRLREKYLAREQNAAGDFSSVREIIEYINENLYTDLSLDGICEKLSVRNKSQLNRVFKKVTGSTVWDYVVIKRLIKAKEMIRSGVKINVASEMVGFHDYSNFYRAYRGHFGVSPKDDVTR